MNEITSGDRLETGTGGQLLFFGPSYGLFIRSAEVGILCRAQINGIILNKLIKIPVPSWRTRYTPDGPHGRILHAAMSKALHHAIENIRSTSILIKEISDLLFPNQPDNEPNSLVLFFFRLLKLVVTTG